MKYQSTLSLRQLKKAEVSQAVRICELAFEEDPLQHYFRCTLNPDDEIAYRENWPKAMAKIIGESGDQGLAWTTEDVGAILLYDKAGKPDESGETMKRASVLSEEQKKRIADWSNKSETVIRETLGDSRHEMAYIELLATSPVMQGRGYASALIRKVVEEAESQGRSTWLMSSNIANTGFYNYHGFLIKAEIVLGRDNPTWNRPPIVVYLMVRKFGTIA